MTQETKDKAAKIWGDVKDGLETGFNASKKGLKKAGEALQSFSDKSVVAVEKKQFESKRKKAYASLGELVAKKLSAKNAAPLSASDNEVDELLKEIAKYNKEISKREKTIKDSEKPSGKSTAKTTKKTAEKK